ncbi:MAG: isopeptide-forming domain-containing fimbrial protein, partial [Desulfuromonadales bacterium]|nr:isopeptide-forming domain-containing fimbrial protein [Desulfuromonadales bacterium]
MLICSPPILTRSGMMLLYLIALMLGATSAAQAASSNFISGDNNSLNKGIIADSYTAPPSTADDKIARIGDTATYRLNLNLSEGTTGSLTVQDFLPSGLAYVGLVGITPASGSGPFTYNVISQPTPGATGGLTWNLGDVDNPPSRDGTPVDTLVIEYQARVLSNAGISIPTANLTNTATLGYLDESGIPVIDPTRLVASDTLVVRQPGMSSIIKLGNGRTNNALDPLSLNVSTQSVLFRLEACNSGLAPAYGLQIRDDLATQLNETSLSVPVVRVGGTVLGAGDYNYVPPSSRGGSLNFILNQPVAPAQCVTISYSCGFYNDFGPNQLWNNSAAIEDYWSLPPAAGQRYNPLTSSSFYMTNLVVDEPLSNIMLAPASGTATIGEQVVYQITVPGTPVLAALDNVIVTDSLHDALAYVDATATLNGAPLAITTSQSGQNLSWSIPSIPARQQVVITLTARVDNNALANAGTVIVNNASFSSDAIAVGVVTDNSSAPLTIVEPSLAITKSVSPLTSPIAGDILTYTVNLTAASGANAATAFDSVIDDILSLGLTYVAGSARVEGAAVEPTVSGDGITIAQTLSWSGGIDINAGTSFAVTYDVRVLGTVVADQVLSNSATAHWTGLAGVSAVERTGSGTPISNDYVAGPATTSQTVTVMFVPPTLQKSVDKPLANPGDRLQYTLTLQNSMAIGLTNITLVDNLEALNMTPMFQPGSISHIVVPAGASATVSGGTLTVNNLDIAPNGSLTILFEAVLATNLASGSIVLNQAQLTGFWPVPIYSDDPTLPGSADPTRTVIPANGVVYDVMTHTPLAGVTLTLLRGAT